MYLYNSVNQCWQRANAAQVAWWLLRLQHWLPWCIALSWHARWLPVPRAWPCVEQRFCRFTKTFLTKLVDKNEIHSREKSPSYGLHFHFGHPLAHPRCCSTRRVHRARTAAILGFSFHLPRTVHLSQPSFILSFFLPSSHSSNLFCLSLDRLFWLTGKNLGYCYAI